MLSVIVQLLLYTYTAVLLLKTVPSVLYDSCQLELGPKPGLESEDSTFSASSQSDVEIQGIPLCGLAWIITRVQILIEV